MLEKGSRSRGFTLVELMVVVSIVSILSVLAVSGLSKSFRKTRNYQALWQGMRNACVTARGEAMRQGTQMAVAVSANQIIIFRDDNHDCKQNNGEPIFSSFPNTSAGDPALTGTQSFTSGSLCATDSSQTMFSFASTGEPAYSDGGSWNSQTSVQVSFSDTSTNQNQSCTIWKSGYVNCGGS